MTRIMPMALAAGIVCCGLAAAPPAVAGLDEALPSPSGPAKGANVLLITVDTLRFDRVGFLSDKYVKTPFMDALASRSLVFTRAYAHATLTRPSHTNILTGTTPLYHGVSDNPGFRLESRYLTMAEHLKAAKYSTGAFIGNFILDSRFGLDQGFDFYDDDDTGKTVDNDGFVERSADRVVSLARRWIADRKEPWFCWVHLFDPHDPYAPPEPYKHLYAKDPYSGEVAFVDAQIGLLLEDLDKRGLRDNTIVVLTSDHGEAFGEKEEYFHGFFAYDNVLHVPLIVAYPGAAPGRVEETAGHVDIFPTICDLLGLRVPEAVQGESLLPLAAGKPRTAPAVYFESMSPYFFIEAAPLSGFIEGGRKYIDQPIREVYDLDVDPGEEVNLAPGTDTSAQQRKLEALKKSLKGSGTKQDLDGRNADIRPLLESLGYVAGAPNKKKVFTTADDLKTLQPVIRQLHLAVEEFKAEKHDQGIKKMQTILRIRPNYMTAYSALADAWHHVGKLDQAVSVLREGLTRNPDSLHLMGRLGLMLVSGKRFKEAIEPLEYSVKKDPTNPDYPNFLGLAYMQTGDLKRAEDSFQKAVLNDPGLTAAYNNLGYLYLTMYVKSPDDRLLDSAIHNFDQALDGNPKLPSALKGRETAINYKERRKSG